MTSWKAPYIRENMRKSMMASIFLGNCSTCSHFSGSLGSLNCSLTAGCISSADQCGAAELPKKKTFLKEKVWENWWKKTSSRSKSWKNHGSPQSAADSTVFDQHLGAAKPETLEKIRWPSDEDDKSIFQACDAWKVYRSKNPPPYTLHYRYTIHQKDTHQKDTLWW